jgi:acetylglutamate kinase
VHTQAIEAIRGAGIVPVIGPVGFAPGDGADLLVNVNADTVAGNIAAALHARQLIFLTDIEGVRGPDGVLIQSLSSESARALIANGTVSGGMIPKVEACLHAVSLGVSVQIVDGRTSGMLLASSGAGTTLTP